MQTNLGSDKQSNLVSVLEEASSMDNAPCEIADQVKEILAGCNVSLLRLEELTRSRYGQGSAYFIPSGFLSRIKKGVQPQIFQLLALSRITDFRLDDWLRVFGIEVSYIPHLQLKLHASRTICVTPNGSLDPPADADDCSFANGLIQDQPSELRNPTRFLYSRIGQSDGMAFPEIMPGSIVRVDTTLNELPASGSSKELFLVEHVGGLSCCHVTRLTRDEVLLTPIYLPYPCLRYRLGEQAVILGTVDAELRPMRDIPIPSPDHNSRMERRLPSSLSKLSPAQLLRISRERLGLRYREAQAITEEIANELGSSGYTIALGSLSDYEASDALPRQIRKMVSLSIAYAFDLATYLTCAGIDLRDQGRRRMSLEQSRNRRHTSLLNPTVPAPLPTTNGCAIPTSLLEGFVRCMKPSDSLESIECYSYAQMNANGPTALLVDRSSTTLERALWHAPWQRPVYLVQHRGGHYLHGFCTITDGLMTVHQNSAHHGTANSYPRGDVEIVGRVIAVLKKRRAR